MDEKPKKRTLRQIKEDEAATRKLRQIKVDLSDADVMRLTYLAEGHGLTVGKLIQGFIGDLVDGTFSHGSDERELAYDWFKRCGFPYTIPDTFVTYTIGAGNMNGCVDSLEDADAFAEYYQDYVSAGGTQSKSEALKAAKCYRERLCDLQSGWG